MSDPSTLELALQTAPIWLAIVKGFLSDRVAGAGKSLVEEGIKEGTKNGLGTAFEHLRDPKGSNFLDAFNNASKSFLARYEFDRDLAEAIIRILRSAQGQNLHDLNREILVSTIFSEKPRMAPLERYCQRVIGMDKIVAENVKAYSLTEVSRALKYFFEELQRELLLSEKWRELVIAFRSLQLQAKIAQEFDPMEMRTEYLSYLRDRYQFLDLKGFSPRISGRVLSLRLTEVFTDVHLEEGRPYISEFAEDELATMSEKQLFELDWERLFDLLEKRYARLEATKPKVRVLKLSDILKNPRIVILGDPGSGKTTLTRYIAITMASEDYYRIGTALQGLLPILVRIADYGRAMEREPNLHLIDYISRELTSDFGPLLRQELDDGKCLVMLDGLDEVAETSHRQRVAERIEDMVAAYGTNRFLTTSRPIGYQSAQLSGEFRHITLCPLTEESQERFVGLWHKEIRSRGAGRSEGTNWFEEPAALIKALRTKSSITKLASNPLLLTIIVLMYWRGTKIPDRRVDIYASATETLIENWPLRQRGIDLDFEQMKSILAPVSLAILSSSVSGVIAQRNLFPLLLEIVQEVHGGTRVEALEICDRLLHDLSEHSGIFLERGRDESTYPVYGFLHQTFGEYLAAMELAERWNVGSLQLSDYVHKARWKEVILLLAGILGNQGRAVASRFATEILELGSPFEDILHRDLLLVLECFGDDMRVKPSIKEDILRKGVELFGHEVFDLQSAALDRIKSLKGTDYATTAIELLKEFLQRTKTKPKGTQRDTTRLMAAEALCELGDLESAKPIIWEISEDREAFEGITGRVQGAVTKLRVLYWTRESLEWLAGLFCLDSWLQPRLVVGKNLRETVIRTPDGTDISIFEYLKEDELNDLLTKLFDCVSDRGIHQSVAWIRIQRSGLEDVQVLRTLLTPETDRSICFLVASRLLDLGHRLEGTTALQQLSSGQDKEAFKAAQRLLELGEPIDFENIRELALFSDKSDSVDLVRKLAEVGEKSLGISILLISVVQSSWFETQWKAVEALSELGQTELAIAAAKFIALTPGHSYRADAIEMLLDSRRESGQFDDIIEFLVELAYDCTGSQQEKAIARLATFRETKLVAPLLFRALNSGDATNQYEIARSLAMGGLAESVKSGDMKGILLRREEKFVEKQAGCLDSFHAFLLLGIEYIDKMPIDKQASPLLSIMKAILLHESGDDGQAEALLQKIEESNGNRNDVRLYAGQVWATWGHSDRAVVAASEVLHTHGISPALEFFAADLLSKFQTELIENELLPVILNSDNQDARVKVIDSLTDPIPSSLAVTLGEIFQNNLNSNVLKKSVVGKLGKPSVPETRKVLLSALKDNSSEVRAIAIESIGKFGIIEFVPNLLSLLSDTDVQVRTAAIAAIEGLSVPVPANELGHVLMSDTSMRVRQSAARALSLANPDEASAYLLQALRIEHQYIRSMALESFRELKGTAGIPVLLSELDNSELDWKSKASVILSLGRFADEDVASRFVPYIHRGPQEIASASAEAIGIQRYDQSAPDLCEILANDNRVGVSVAVINSLAVLSHETIIPALLSASNSQEERVREASAKALTIHGTINVPTEVTQKLNDLFNNDRASTVRDAAINGLSWLDPVGALELLPCALLDESSDVRKSAVIALGYLGNNDNVRQLSGVLYDSDREVREAALKSIGQIGGPNASMALRFAHQNGETYLRSKAALALASMGDSHFTDLVLIDPYTWEPAIYALGYIADETSIEKLVELLRWGRSDTKITSAKCLARVAPQKLLPLLNDPFINRCLGLDAKLLFAETYHYLGNSSLAVEAFENSLEEIRVASLSTRGKIGPLYNLILDAFELSYYSQSVNALKLLIQLYPKEPVYHIDLGIAYRIMREYGLSSQKYHDSLNLQPTGSIEIYNGLGILAYNQGDENKALQYFEKSLQLAFNVGDLPRNYWTNSHNTHMFTVALLGSRHGEIGVERLKQAMRTLRWDPGVVTEILWDVEQLAELNPRLPGLSDLLDYLQNINMELEQLRRGSLRSP